MHPVTSNHMNLGQQPRRRPSSALLPETMAGRVRARARLRRPVERRARTSRIAEAAGCDLGRPARVRLANAERRIEVIFNDPLTASHRELDVLEVLLPNGFSD